MFFDLETGKAVDSTSNSGIYRADDWIHISDGYGFVSLLVSKQDITKLISILRTPSYQNWICLSDYLNLVLEKPDHGTVNIIFDAKGIHYTINMPLQHFDALAN